MSPSRYEAPEWREGWLPEYGVPTADWTDSDAANQSNQNPGCLFSPLAWLLSRFSPPPTFAPTCPPKIPPRKLGEGRSIDGGWFRRRGDLEDLNGPNGREIVYDEIPPDYLDDY